MKKKSNWNELNLKERLMLIEHNSDLKKYHTYGNYFAVGAFVNCKQNGNIGYIIRHIDSERFEDDGEISGFEPSNSCRYKNYTMI